MTTQSSFPKYHASVGDRARCEAGHVVATFIAPVIGGEAFLPSLHLASWNIGEDHQKSGICPCGGRWLMGAGIYQRTRISSDWMAPLDDRIEAEAARQKAIAGPVKAEAA